jgi:benzylsuccinate CoA-transferase BbsE subunit
MMGQVEGVLGGTVVVEIGDEGVQGCGKLFADLGATVIKVEPPGGVHSRHRGPYAHGVRDPNRSLYFWANNTSKFGVTFDLEVDDECNELHELIEQADVLLEDLPPGALDAVGLGWKAVSRRNPGLIVTSVTPFGQTGPHASWKGSDLVCWAMGGGAWLLGYSDSEIPPLVPQGDLAFQMASLWAAVGTLAALEERAATGKGQRVDVSVQEACALVVGPYDSGPYEYQHVVPHRRDGPARIVTRDGKYLIAQMLNIPTTRWVAFVEWLRAQGEGQVLWDEDPATFESRPDLLEPVIEHLAASRTSQELVLLGQQFGFTWMAVNSPEDVFHDPQLRSRGFFRSVEHPELGETFEYAGPAAELSERGWKIRWRAPLLGEHNSLWRRDH